MSLSLASGPFGRSPAGAFNFDIDAAAPPHRIYFTDFLPRVRAIVAGSPVLDTTRAKLLYETGIPPRLYAPIEDFDEPRLQGTDHSTHCPFKGDASYHSVVTGDDVRENAIWEYREPTEAAAWLAGHASLYHEQADEWWVEDELQHGHLRDPFHRIDVLPSSRRVRVTGDGSELVATDRAMLLYETGLPVRVYVPRADVQGPIERVEGKTTHCPYKGDASYWTVAGITSAAWSYEYPRAEATGIAGLLAFDPEQVAVELG